MAVLFVSLDGRSDAFDGDAEDSPSLSGITVK